MRARILAAAVAAGLALAAPAAAQDTSLAGETDNGFSVKLTVGEFGNATAFRVGGGKIDCKRGGTLTTRAVTYDRLDRSDPGSFSNKSKGVARDGAIKLKSTVRIAGSAEEGFASWSGSLKSTTKVIRDGKKIDTCKLKANWQAA